MVDLSNRLPRPLARTCGEAVGLAFWLFMRDERERAVERARAALGRSREESRKLVRRCAVRMGSYLADAVRLEVWSREELSRVIRLEGLANLSRALSAGRGAFVLSAHLGNWEVLAAAIAAAGVPFGVIARRPDDLVLAARLEALRLRWGVESFWREDGPRPILKALRSGRAVGVLIDQATAVESANVPFFGRPARTPTGPARLAIRTGAPVVLVHCVDAPDGTYVGTFEPPLWVHKEDTSDPVALTAAWTRHIEGWIRQLPHTWVWMHDRWADTSTRRVREEVAA